MVYSWRAILNTTNLGLEWFYGGGGMARVGSGVMGRVSLCSSRFHFRWGHINVGIVSLGVEVMATVGLGVLRLGLLGIAVLGLGVRNGC